MESADELRTAIKENCRVVDHILPVSIFDHTDPDQVRRCWHWTNLQPLESLKNAAKGDKITDPQFKLAI